MKISTLLITLTIFLVSCRPAHVLPPTAMRTSIPISNRLPQPTSTGTQRPTLTSTPPPYPTLPIAKKTDAVIDTRVAGAIQTQLYYMNMEAPATLKARNVKCKDGFVLERSLDILFASNDAWTLFTCSPIVQNEGNAWTPGAVNYGTRYTQINKNDLSKTWIIQHNTFNYSYIDRPDALMSPYRWTTDGNYLYLYPSYYPAPSGFPASAFLYAHINSLYRINLGTGNFELVLRNGQFGDFELSPGDQFLAYSEYKRPDVIHVKNMESGKDMQVKLDEDIVASGAFIWSSDSTKVVFSVGYGKQIEDWQEDLSGTAFYVLTPKNMRAQKVSGNDPRIFKPYKCQNDTFWFDENTICIYSINQEMDSWNKIFTLNIVTGEVEFLHPSP